MPEREDVIECINDDTDENHESLNSVTKVNLKRKKKACPPQAQALSVQLADLKRELRKPSPYEEERMENIVRNQVMVLKLFEGKTSPGTKVNMKRKKAGPAHAQALSVSVQLADLKRELRKPSPYEEERMQNIARNQEMVRKLFEGKASPATKVNLKRKKKACPPQAQALSVQLADLKRELRKPSPFEEERMENIARNQEMVRKLIEGKASPATKVNMKRKKKACPPQAQALSVQLADLKRELRKPSPFEEERMQNITRNQEMVRKLIEGKASPATKVNN